MSETVIAETELKAKKKKVKLQLKSPSQQRSKQTVATILQACEKIIIQEGFYGVSTDKIAKEAGVSIGSLYQFFGNKDSVVSALIQDLFESDLRFFKENFNQIMSLQKQDRIHALVTAGIKIYSTRQEVRARVLHVYQYLLDQKYFQEILNQYVEMIAQIIDTPNRDSKMVARIFLTAIIGLFDSAIINNPKFVEDTGFLKEVSLLFETYLNAKV